MRAREAFREGTPGVNTQPAKIAELVEQARTGMSGDCLFCMTFELSGHHSDDHLLSHLAEGYVMFSLALNAVVERGYPIPSLILEHAGDLTRRAIRKYLTTRLLHKGYSLDAALREIEGVS